MNDKNQYDILPTISNINQYNRYPFACYEEAYLSLMDKHLQPGEMAVGYYFDESSLIGINAVFAFGNLKKQGNIVFKNGDLFDKQFEDILRLVSKQNQTINQVVDSINHANKNWSTIVDRLNVFEKMFEKINGVSCIKILDLDKFEYDIKK